MNYAWLRASKSARLCVTNVCCWLTAKLSWAAWSLPRCPASPVIMAEKSRARISSATSASTSSSREIDDEYLLEQASHTAVQILAVDIFC